MSAFLPKADVYRTPSQGGLFGFNSEFLRMNQAHRSASSSRQRFDRPPPHPQDGAHDRTIGGRRQNRSERHAWRSETYICKPRKKVPLSALSNEGNENNSSRIDPSRWRSSSFFDNLRKLCRA